MLIEKTFIKLICHFFFFFFDAWVVIISLLLKKCCPNIQVLSFEASEYNIGHHHIPKMVLRSVIFSTPKLV